MHGIINRQRSTGQTMQTTTATGSRNSHVRPQY